MRNDVFGSNAILLSRVSTDAQSIGINEDGSPKLSQMQVLLDWAKNLGFENFKQFSSVESGFKNLDDKEGWNKVTEFIEANPSYQTICCTELTRLGRKASVLSSIKEYCSENGIQLLCKADNFALLDSTKKLSINSDLIFNIYMSLCTMEMNRKIIRMQYGLKVLKSKGISLGGKRLFGYKREYTKHANENTEGGSNSKQRSFYVIDENEAKEIATIYDWYLNGIDGDRTKCSTKKIADECAIRGMSNYLHSKRNVNKCLKEQAYTGYKITNNMRKNPEYWNYGHLNTSKYVHGTNYECKYPIIIDKEIFDSVQEKLKNHLSYDNDKSTHISILSKLIKCPNSIKQHNLDERIPEHYFGAEYRNSMNLGTIRHTYRCRCRGKAEITKCDNKWSFSMVLMDSIIWQFVKDNVTSITLNLRRKKDEINQMEIKTKIERMKSMIEEQIQNIILANELFIRNHKSFGRYNKFIEEEKAKNDKAVKNAEYEIAKLEKNIRIAEKELSLWTPTEDIEKVVLEQIELIETDKALMHKYVHLLVKEIVPLHHTTKFTVLKVTGMDNCDEVFDYSLNKDNMPNIVGHKHDGVYYIIIDKRVSRYIKSRIIHHYDAYFDTTTNCFIFEHDDSTNSYSLEDIMAYDLSSTDVEYFNDLHGCLKDLPFNRLAFYDEDFIDKEKALESKSFRKRGKKSP